MANGEAGITGRRVLTRVNSQDKDLVTTQNQPVTEKTVSVWRVRQLRAKETLLVQVVYSTSNSQCCICILVFVLFCQFTVNGLNGLNIRVQNHAKAEFALSRDSVLTHHHNTVAITALAQELKMNNATHNAVQVRYPIVKNYNGNESSH